MTANPELVTNWRKATQLLIETNDLDPMYSVIAQIRQDYDDEWYYQFLMHYSLFYDPRGAMAAIDIEPQDFWPWIENLAAIPATPRGQERRHFRGKAAKAAIQNLRAIGSPTHIFKTMYANTYSKLVENIENKFVGCSFGSYFTWKLMDFFNVCSGRPVSLSYEETKRYMPDQPRKAVEELIGGWSKAIVVNEFVQQFKHPVRVGQCDWAETETVLCNLKGLFLTGTVWIGRDIDHYRTILRGTGYDRYLPPLVNRTQYPCMRLEETFDV